MKVKIIKSHPTWSFLYPNELQVGDIVDLDVNTVTTQSGLKFNANDLTKSISNVCSYPDIFEKIN